jgi:uncharacterized BrkB/YihY/UPF0761 family membrane protein
MGHKRKPSVHQKQLRFFTILFGTLMVLVVGALIWFFNRVNMPAH